MRNSNFQPIWDNMAILINVGAVRKYRQQQPDADVNQTEQLRDI
jgi:hypothetical protein